MPKQTAQRGRRWYVLHTYSGYEENVARNLRQRIESMDMEDKIFDVLIPTEKKIRIKDGKRKVVRKQIAAAKRAGTQTAAAARARAAAGMMRTQEYC